MTIFVGPVAAAGGPAIKNSITLRHLDPDGRFKIVNTYRHDPANRFLGVAQPLLSRDRQMIVATSAKGRRALLPLMHFKAHRDPSFRCSVICIGGTIAGEAEDDPRYIGYLNAADVVTTETMGVLSQLAALGVEKSRLHLMTNFVDDLATRRVVRLREIKEPTRFVFLSSVRNKKGIGTMLAAFRAALACGLEASLDIYGPIRPDFDRSLLEGIRDDEPIVYRGIVPNDKVVAVLMEYDCFVFPTEYETEGFPAVLAEAMAAGLPIIASDACFNSEIVREGTNGWLYPAGNSFALGELFLRVGTERDELARISAANSEDGLRYDAAVVVGSYRDALLARGWSL